MSERAFFTIAHPDFPQTFRLWDGTKWTDAIDDPDGFFHTGEAQVLKDELIRMSSLDVEGQPLANVFEIAANGGILCKERILIKKITLDGVTIHT